jgi:hypothetical protein
MLIDGDPIALRLRTTRRPAYEEWSVRVPTQARGAHEQPGSYSICQQRHLREENHPMSDQPPAISRRKLLTTGALGVAAGFAASTGLAALPAAVEAAAGPRPAAKPEPVDLTAVGDDVVAHVRDASTGEVALLVGTSELVYHDPALVGRILAGARRAQSEG